MQPHDMLIKIETLDVIFVKQLPETSLNIDGRCSICGAEVKIVITKTSGGYGFLNGVLTEPGDGRFIPHCARCMHCSETDP